MVRGRPARPFPRGNRRPRPLGPPGGPDGLCNLVSPPPSLLGPPTPTVPRPRGPPPLIPAGRGEFLRDERASDGRSWTSSPGGGQGPAPVALLVPQGCGSYTESRPLRPKAPGCQRGRAGGGRFHAGPPSVAPPRRPYKSPWVGAPSGSRFLAIGRDLGPRVDRAHPPSEAGGFAPTDIGHRPL